MASYLREHSAPAVVPSSTPHPPVYDFVLPSILTRNLTPHATWLYTTLAIVFSLLALEQSVWRYKKRHLPGDKWTIPVIGRFADSVKPTMEGYKKQWDSGALSAISVFNMHVHLRPFFFCLFILTSSIVLSSWPPQTSTREKFSTRQALQRPGWCTLASKS